MTEQQKQENQEMLTKRIEAVNRVKQLIDSEEITVETGLFMMSYIAQANFQ